MKLRLRDIEADGRTVPARRDEEIAAWLGDGLAAWEPEGLVIRNPAGRLISAPTGWLLVRWPDGWLSVSSDEAARRIFEPVDE
jgi:hypothetical protein